MSNQLKQMFDFKLVAVTLISVIVLMPVLTYVHELGHVFACEMAGNEAKFQVSILGASGICMGKFDDPTVYRYSGGFLAATIGFMAFVLIRKHLTGAWRGIGIALVSIAIIQYIGGILEGYLNDFYMESKFVSVIQTMILLSLIIFFVHRNSFKEERQ